MLNISLPPFGGVVALQYTLAKLLQLENALLPIEVTLLGIVTLVKLLQLENALLPIEVTLFGIVTLVKQVQS